MSNMRYLGPKYYRFDTKNEDLNDMKLFGKGDLKLCRLRHQGATHYFITPCEMRAVMQLVNDAAYILYSYYRTGFFHEAEDLADEVVAKVISWDKQKVQKSRLALEKANLFRVIRHGTKTVGITQVLVGIDTVALHDAGLPPDIIDGKAFTKLKKKFKVQSTEDLIKCAEAMAKEYEMKPELYK